MGRYGKFRQKVWQHYRLHGRHNLAWRKSKIPYRTAVSEIMLQQTQVKRVEKYFSRFIKRFPNWKALAQATPRAVLSEWSGLGYNRRAIRLHKLAQGVAHEHRGLLPRNFTELRKLPGLGPYTARAILALAFNVPVAIVETNIRKVIIDNFFEKRSRISESDIQRVADKLLVIARPRDWNLALMDYGAAQYKGKGDNPNKRSKIYTRQSVFEGSKRQVRATIIKVMLNTKKITLHSLTQELSQLAHTNTHTIKLAQIMSELYKDGLVKKRGRYYSLE